MVAALTGFPPAQIKRLVVKIGSALLVDRAIAAFTKVGRDLGVIS